jgi:hypothetical protein
MTGHRLLAIALVLAGACSKAADAPPDACLQVARKLMPNPEEHFLKACRAQLGDPAFARMLDCVLAIPEIHDDKQIKACPGGDRMPSYFQF